MVDRPVGCSFPSVWDRGIEAEVEVSPFSASCSFKFDCNSCPIVSISNVIYLFYSTKSQEISKCSFRLCSFQNLGFGILLNLLFIITLVSLFIYLHSLFEIPKSKSQNKHGSRTLIVTSGQCFPKCEILISQLFSSLLMLFLCFRSHLFTFRILFNKTNY